VDASILLALNLKAFFFFFLFAKKAAVSAMMEVTSDSIVNELSYALSLILELGRVSRKEGIGLWFEVVLCSLFFFRRLLLLEAEKLVRS
jgi:hypothetical protein